MFSSPPSSPVDLEIRVDGSLTTLPSPDQSRRSSQLGDWGISCQLIFSHSSIPDSVFCTGGSFADLGIFRSWDPDTRLPRYSCAIQEAFSIILACHLSLAFVAAGGSLSSVTIHLDFPQNIEEIQNLRFSVTHQERLPGRAQGDALYLLLFFMRLLLLHTPRLKFVYTPRSLQPMHLVDCCANFARLQVRDFFTEDIGGSSQRIFCTMRWSLSPRRWVLDLPCQDLCGRPHNCTLDPVSGCCSAHSAAERMAGNLLNSRLRRRGIRTRLHRWQVPFWSSTWLPCPVQIWLDFAGFPVIPPTADLPYGALALGGREGLLRFRDSFLYEVSYSYLREPYWQRRTDSFHLTQEERRTTPGLLPQSCLAYATFALRWDTDMEFETALPGFPPPFLQLHPYRELLHPSFPPYLSVRYSLQFALRFTRPSLLLPPQSAPVLALTETTSAASSSGLPPPPVGSDATISVERSPAPPPESSETTRITTPSTVEMASSTTPPVDQLDGIAQYSHEPRDRWFFTSDRLPGGLCSWTFIASNTPEYIYSNRRSFTLHREDSRSVDGFWCLIPDAISPTERRWLNLETGEFFFEVTGLDVLVPLDEWVRRQSSSGLDYIFCPRDPMVSVRRFLSDTLYQAPYPWQAYVTDPPESRLWWFNHDTEEYFFDP